MILILSDISYEVQCVVVHLLSRVVIEKHAFLVHVSGILSMKRGLDNAPKALIIYGKGDEKLLLECAAKAVNAKVCPVFFVYTCGMSEPCIDGVVSIYRQMGSAEDTPDLLYYALDGKIVYD